MAQPSLVLAITGGTGFVGGYIIREALSAGYTVRALVRRPEAVSDFTHERLTWIKGALGDNDEALVAGSDVVIHLAGLIKARTSEAFYKVNSAAAGDLAGAAQKASVKRFVFVSSMAAAEPDLSDYAGSKRAGERAVQKAFTGPVSIVRAPAVFGPGDKATEPFFTLLKKGLLPVPGGKNWKSRKISMSFAPDLAREIVAMAGSGKNDGEIVSPATMPKLTWHEFAQLCETAFERKVKVIPLPLTALYPIAGITSVTSRLFGLGHLTLGKLGEFLHADWSSETLISAPTPPIEALKITMAAYSAPTDQAKD